VAFEDGSGDVHDLPVGSTSLFAKEMECLLLVEGPRSIKIPLARSVMARRQNAPSSAWYSANR
jgi:hypothetical protein